MKKIYKVSIIILAAIVVVVSAVFFLKREKTEPIFNDKIKHDLAVADFKEGEEYQFKGIPWGISPEELKGMVPYSLFEDPIRPTTDFHSTESYLLFGKTTDVIFKFEEDKLAEVQLIFPSEEEKAIEQFDSIVAEATELFGTESEKVENTLTVDLGYIWKTDNTMLEITAYKVGDQMNIFIRPITESESTGKVMNNEETANNETSNETESDENTEGLIEFKLADLKQGDEYQIDLVPLGTSWYELRPWQAFNGYHTIVPEGSSGSVYDPSVVQKFVWSTDECLLEGKHFNAVYEFLHDELVDVKLDFRSEKNIAEHFEPFVAELTKQFGPETRKDENPETGGLAYTWQTENTRLQIDLVVLNDTTKDMTLSIGYTEKERDQIQTENIKESRELLLTGFKQDQGYQFEEVAWKSSVEEVETLLNGNLKDVTVEAPRDYVFYDFKDVAYVLDGHEAKASFEFQSDELVFIGFKFYDLEDIKGFFEENVLLLKDEYGTETDMTQNEDNGYISYRWRMENTQLLISFYEKQGGEVVSISLASLK